MLVKAKGVTKSMIRLRKTYVRSGLEASTMQVERGTCVGESGVFNKIQRCNSKTRKY
jgi:hypothetical protein